MVSTLSSGFEDHTTKMFLTSVSHHLNVFVFVLTFLTGLTVMLLLIFKILTQWGVAMIYSPQLANVRNHQQLRQKNKYKERTRVKKVKKNKRKRKIGKKNKNGRRRYRKQYNTRCFKTESRLAGKQSSAADHPMVQNNVQPDMCYLDLFIKQNFKSELRFFENSIKCGLGIGDTLDDVHLCSWRPRLSLLSLTNLADGQFFEHGTGPVKKSKKTKRKKKAANTHSSVSFSIGNTTLSTVWRKRESVGTQTQDVSPSSVISFTGCKEDNASISALPADQPEQSISTASVPALLVDQPQHTNSNASISALPVDQPEQPISTASVPTPLVDQPEQTSSNASISALPDDQPEQSIFTASVPTPLVDQPQHTDSDASITQPVPLPQNSSSTASDSVQLLQPEHFSPYQQLATFHQPSFMSPIVHEPGQQLSAFECSGIFSQQPKHLDMVLSATRISTFCGWPLPGSHPPSDMARAGFYYTGSGDAVRCFYCGIGIMNWETEEEPWIEHCRWSHDCPLVRLFLGQRYINAVQTLALSTNGQKITTADVSREMRRTSRGHGEASTESTVGEQVDHASAAAAEDLHSGVLCTTNTSVSSSDLGPDRPPPSGPLLPCMNCHRKYQEVQLPCGHANLCLACFSCPFVWGGHYADEVESWKPRCLVCGREYHAVQVETAMANFAHLRRIRADPRVRNMKRCCAHHVSYS